MVAYYVLAVLENGKYTVQFGDYVRKVVADEKRDSYRGVKSVIVKTVDNQFAINASIEALNAGSV